MHSELALAIAKVGGMGVLHRNLDAETQAGMYVTSTSFFAHSLRLRWVRKKIHYGGMVDKV